MILSLLTILALVTQVTEIIQFTFEKSIDIPAEFPVSIIEQVDIDEAGNILITDSSTASVILYTKSDQSFRKLDSRECHPGFNHQPVKTYFTGMDIWMMHAHSQVFRFSTQGDCIGAINGIFFIPDLFGGKVTSVLAGFRPHNNNFNEPVLELYSEQVKTTKRIELSSHIIAPNMSFRFQGGGIITIDSFIYLATSSSPAIYEVKNENVTTYLTEIPGVSYSVNDDITLDNSNAMASLFKETESYRKRNTIVRNFFSLNDDFLVVNIISPGTNRDELIFFDLNNRTFLDVKYTLTDPPFIHHISENKAYKITEDTTRDRVDWIINVYEIELILKD